MSDSLGDLIWAYYQARDYAERTHGYGARIESDERCEKLEQQMVQVIGEIAVAAVEKSALLASRSVGA